VRDLVVRFRNGIILTVGFMLDLLCKSHHDG